jgi:hypothetical protein
MAELLLGHHQVLEEAQAGAKKRLLATPGCSSTAGQLNGGFGNG